MSVYTKRFVRCLKCGEGEFSVEHLFRENFAKAGPWYCDLCGEGHDFELRGGDLDVSLAGKTKRKTTVLLRLPPQAEPIYFLVHGMAFSSSKKEDLYSNARYFYEEHTCATNWLKDVQCVLAHGSADPHGLAELADFRDEPIPHSSWGDGETDPVSRLIREMVSKVEKEEQK